MHIRTLRQKLGEAGSMIRTVRNVGYMIEMKRKIHMELLATAVFAILLTLLCALFVFYGVYRKQVIGDLKADALVMKNLHIFDNISDLPGCLRPEPGYAAHHGGKCQRERYF